MTGLQDGDLVVAAIFPVPVAFVSSFGPPFVRMRGLERGECIAIRSSPAHVAPAHVFHAIADDDPRIANVRQDGNRVWHADVAGVPIASGSTRTLTLRARAMLAVRDFHGGTE